MTTRDKTLNDFPQTELILMMKELESEGIKGAKEMSIPLENQATCSVIASAGLFIKMQKQIDELEARIKELE